MFEEDGFAFLWTPKLFSFGSIPSSFFHAQQARPRILNSRPSRPSTPNFSLGFPVDTPLTADLVGFFHSTARAALIEPTSQPNGLTYPFRDVQTPKTRLKKSDHFASVLSLIYIIFPSPHTIPSLTPSPHRPECKATINTHILRIWEKHGLEQGPGTGLLTRLGKPGGVVDDLNRYRGLRIPGNVEPRRNF